MKLQFKDDIQEYKNGPYYRKNEGEPFDVDARFGNDLIRTGFFEQVAEKPKELADFTKPAKKAKESKK